VPAAAHFSPQRGVPGQHEHRVGRGARIAERHHEPAFVAGGEIGRGRQRCGHHRYASRHVLHHLGGQGMAEVGLVLEQRQARQCAVNHRHGLVVGYEAWPAEQAAFPRGFDHGPGLRVGRTDQLDRDAVRAQQGRHLDHLGHAPVRGEPADVDDPLGGVRRVRRRRGLRHVGGVRHHRVRAAEPLDVALFGQDEVQPVFGQPFRRVHGRGRRGPQRAGQPRLGGERGGGVLVHVPHRRRALPPRGQGKQQLGVVDQQQVGAGAVPGQLAAGGAQGAEPAPSHGSRDIDDLELRPGPFCRKVFCAGWGDVGDMVACLEQGRDLAVVDARVGRVVDDRAHQYPHRKLTGLRRAARPG
jgi:hypothetical protein